HSGGSAELIEVREPVLHEQLKNRQTPLAAEIFVAMAQHHLAAIEAAMMTGHRGGFCHATCARIPGSQARRLVDAGAGHSSSLTTELSNGRTIRAHQPDLVQPCSKLERTENPLKKPDLQTN